MMIMTSYSSSPDGCKRNIESTIDSGYPIILSLYVRTSTANTGGSKPSAIILHSARPR